MDGVLVDNMAVHGEVFRLFCEKYGHRNDVYDINRYAGMGNADIIPAVIPADVVSKYGVEWLGDEKERMYREYYADKMKPAEGIVSFLEGLRGLGIKRAVGSSGQELNVNFVLDGCDLRQYFDAIVNGDMVEHHKPEPDIFLLAASKLGLPPESCVVVEDSLSGIAAAHRAGMKVIAITTTFPREELEKHHPTLIIDSFTELTATEAISL